MGGRGGGGGGWGGGGGASWGRGGGEGGDGRMGAEGRAVPVRSTVTWLNVLIITVHQVKPGRYIDMDSLVCCDIELG